jgi:ABC-type dipeptide/oligopeptide/nickel transport system permease component
MLTMILKRAAMAIPSLIGVVIVTFLLTRALPGDPAAYFAGPAATPQAIQEVRVKPRPRQSRQFADHRAAGTHRVAHAAAGVG